MMAQSRARTRRSSKINHTGRGPIPARVLNQLEPPSRAGGSVRRSTFPPPPPAPGVASLPHSDEVASDFGV